MSVHSFELGFVIIKSLKLANYSLLTLYLFLSTSNKFESYKCELFVYHLS